MKKSAFSPEFIQVDGNAYECCKRYHLYSKHSYKCYTTNNWNVDTDIEVEKITRNNLNSNQYEITKRRPNK